jgi:uncharacterized repeat protein (TIGR02543 family)
MVKLRKLVSILVTLALILTIFPAAAFADEETAGASPSATVSVEPSIAPSEEPSVSPSEEPSTAPSEEPSTAPSEEPSIVPSEEPSTAPSEEPSIAPSEEPSIAPSEGPSASPSEQQVMYQSMVMAPMAMKNITLKLEGGSINNSTADYVIQWQNNTNINAGDVPAPTRKGYNFEGWYQKGFLGIHSDINFPYRVTGNETWYADWEVKSYPLTITAGPHGSITTRYLLKDKYDYGTVVDLWWAGADADGNYDFDYWLDNETGLPVSGTQIRIDENNSYTAIFKGEPRHLHTDAQANGTLGHDLDGFYPHGSQVNLMDAVPTPTTEGYEFKYWEEATGSWPNWVWKQTDPVITVGMLNEYRAVFGKQQFTVTWKFGNGTPDKTVTADYGSNITGQIPGNPAKNGYEFTGWVYDSGSAADLSNLEHNMTITASYNQLTVSGITVTGCDVPYDGLQHSVAVSGNLTGLTVEYSTDGGLTYSAANPTFKNVSTQTVTVRVSKTDYLPYIGSATVQITKKPLTVTARNESVSYGSSVPAYSVDYGEFAAGEGPGNLTGSLGFTCAYTPTSPVGTYKITPKGLSSGNYEIQFVDGTLTVTPATMTVPVTGYSGIYDGAYHSVNVGSQSGDTVTYSTDNVTYSATKPEYRDVTPDSGITLWVKVERPNYEPYTTSATVKITKAPLVITANNFTVAYGDPVPGYTARYDGFVGGDDAGSLVSPVAFNCSYSTSSSVGEYAISPYGAASGNYEIAYADGKVIVNEAGMTVPVTGYTGVYDGLEHSVTVGSLPGDTVTYSTDGGATYLPAQPFFKDVTAGQTVYVRVERANYLPYTTSAAVTITKAPLTVTADDQTVAFGADAPAYTVQYSGFVGGDNAAALGTSELAFDCLYSAGSVVGTYEIWPKGLDWSNYQINFAKGTLTVNPAPQDIAVNGYDGVYDGAAHSVTFSGDMTGTAITYSTDGVTYDSAKPTYTNVTAGETVYVRVERANYITYEGQADVKIAKAPLTVTAENKNTAYGQAAPAFTVTYSGFVGSDNETALGTDSLNFICTYAAGSPVADYSITPAGLSWSNYEISYMPGTLTVDKVDLTVLAQNKSVTYGDDAPAFDADYSGFITGEDAGSLGGALAFECAYSAGSPAGGYTIKPEGLTSDNYNIIFKDGTLTVGKAELKITADDKSITYGGAVPAYTATYSGFVAGDDESDLTGTLSLDSGYAAMGPAGAYTINAGGLESQNYTITYVLGTLTVDKAPLTVTGNDEVLTYGDAAPAYTASYSGFVNGDNPASLDGALTFDCGYAKGSPVGTYAITPGGLSSANYAITFAAGTLKVNAAPAPVYRVAFMNYDGTLLKVQWVDENNAATAPANPARPGYTFAGWSIAYDKVTSDLTITALFTPVAAAPAAAPTVAPPSPTTIPEENPPEAAPSQSVSPSPSSQPTETISEDETPQAVPQVQQGMPMWAWILIAAGVAGFLFWLFFLLRKKRREQENG